MNTRDWTLEDLKKKGLKFKINGEIPMPKEEPVKKHKFRATPTVVDGIKFHSKKEAKDYQELKLLEKEGKIKNLTLQPKFYFLVCYERLNVQLEMHTSDCRKTKTRSPLLIAEYNSPCYKEKLTYKADFMYEENGKVIVHETKGCLLYTSPSPRD